MTPPSIMSGNEMQMSAYYVLLSLGLFETDGGCATRPFYTLATPVFCKVIIHPDDKFYRGKTFTIIVDNNPPQNEYIQSAILDGKSLNRRGFIMMKSYMEERCIMK